MDPVTALIILGIIAYVAASPDPVSLSASRGSVGAIRSGVRSVGQSIGADWRSGGLERAKRRSERLDGWRKARTERDKKGRLVASPNERRRAAVGLSSAWASDRVKGAGRSAGRAVKAGVTSLPAGYRDGVEKARAKREQGVGVRDKIRGYYERRIERDALRHLANGGHGSMRASNTNPTKVQPKDSASPGGGEKGDNVAVKDALKSGARKVGKNVAELVNTGHLARECKDIHQDIEEARAILKGIKGYCDALPERYAAADFHTKGIAQGVAGAGEADVSGALKTLDQLDEQFVVIEKAVKESDAIGEAAAAQQGEGNVQAFQPA